MRELNIGDSSFFGVFDRIRIGQFLLSIITRVELFEYHPSDLHSLAVFCLVHGEYTTDAANGKIGGNRP